MARPDEGARRDGMREARRRGTVRGNTPMMTREDFEKTVRAMRTENVPLTMPNLMLRTELPRSVIETWLEEIDNPPPPASNGKAGASGSKDEAKAETPGEVLKDAVESLRKEFVEKATGAVIGAKLGLGDEKAERAKTGSKARKDLRAALAFGLVFGPVGLFYCAPYKVAALASLVYLPAVVGLSFIPGVGLIFLTYLVPLTHILSAAAGGAYAWRFNRSGQRGSILPESLLGGSDDR